MFLVAGRAGKREGPCGRACGLGEMLPFFPSVRNKYILASSCPSAAEAAVRRPVPCVSPFRHALSVVSTSYHSLRVAGVVLRTVGGTKNRFFG